MLRRVRRCRFCQREMGVPAAAHVRNPFCAVCLGERMPTRDSVVWLSDGDEIRLAPTSETRRGARLRLVGAYPHHEFIIDVEEAKELFNRVRSPSEDESKLDNFIALRRPGSQGPVAHFIDDPVALGATEPPPHSGKKGASK